MRKFISPCIEQTALFFQGGPLHGLLDTLPAWQGAFKNRAVCSIHGDKAFSLADRIHIINFYLLIRCQNEFGFKRGAVTGQSTAKRMSAILQLLSKDKISYRMSREFSNKISIKPLDLNGKMGILSKPFVTLNAPTHLGPVKGKGV